MDLKLVKMCSTNKIPNFETKESDGKFFCAQENNQVNNNSSLDLNQNHKKSASLHLRQSPPSPINSSSSSVSSISPGEPPTNIHPSQTSQESSTMPELAQHVSSSGYDRPPIEPFYPIPVNTSTNGISPMDQYRLQFYNYAMVERLRNQNHANLQHLYPPVAAAYNSRLALSMSLFHNRVFQPEEPKPQHSYIGLIAMAILSTVDQKLVLSDIYQHILDNYPYFRTRGPGWRNSIRHNLSLNDCFIKSGRSANGKGHFWGIHPANLEDFKKGDFRRRKAQRKVRKHMGLSVDDDGTDSPSPPPLALTPPPGLVGFPSPPFGFRFGAEPHWTPMVNAATLYTQSSRKRQFDVASLLAPDNDDQTKIENLYPPSKRIHLTSPIRVEQEDEDIDVVANDDACPEDANHRRLISDDSNYLQHPAHHHRWNNFLPSFDPRIIGRCYGQYMAQHQAVNKRLFNCLNQTSEVIKGGCESSDEMLRKDAE
jgi:hypothetical protein